MLTREQAYNDYLSRYETNITNWIKNANEKGLTHICLTEKVPQEIINELKKLNYTIVPCPPELFKVPSLFGGERELCMPESIKISWD